MCSNLSTKTSQKFWPAIVNIAENDEDLGQHDEVGQAETENEKIAGGANRAVAK